MNMNFDSNRTHTIKRETMNYDVLIVGAGPAGLATAIHLKQLYEFRERALSICVLEKATSVGAHSLSGGILDISSFNELLPNWQKQYTLTRTPVCSSDFLYLTKHHAIKLPTPPQIIHQGDCIISLGELCTFLAEEAERLGVDIFPNFAASEILYDEKGSVRGVLTGVMGVNEDGTLSDRYEPGIEVLALQTVLAEGCRGSLSQQVIQHFSLASDCDPQIYGLGIKELWEIDPKKMQLGKIVHSIGWPLSQQVYGGGFLYHVKPNQVAVGFVVSLDYQNPYLSPFEEFQRFKTHPVIRETLKNGQRIAYGARALAEGGIQSLPKSFFPGGILVGDAAGFLNVPRIKGIHTAIKSGLLAAKAIDHALTGNLLEATIYMPLFRQSSLYDELWRARNIRPSFRWGLWPALIYSAIDTYCFRGRAPWTLHHQHADHQRLRLAAKSHPIKYPSPDNQLTFDRTSSVYLANIAHQENQPIHLVLKDPDVPIKINLALYDAPEQRYCPAQVYEILEKAGQQYLQINASNCVHCKACDIKDPTQNIVWITPEGGSGPNYSGM